MVFLTDGKPTIGESDADAILKHVAGLRQGNVRVFAFGVGHKVNTHLLDRISGEHGGVSRYIEPNEDIEIKVSTFYDKISTPVLSRPEVSVDGLKLKMLHPREPGDLFAGEQIILTGRYNRRERPCDPSHRRSQRRASHLRLRGQLPARGNHQPGNRAALGNPPGGLPHRRDSPPGGEGRTPQGGRPPRARVRHRHPLHFLPHPGGRKGLPGPRPLPGRRRAHPAAHQQKRPGMGCRRCRRTGRRPLRDPDRWFRSRQHVSARRNRRV